MGREVFAVESRIDEIPVILRVVAELSRIYEKQNNLSSEMKLSGTKTPQVALLLIDMG